jgi:hypothetical protein
MIAKAAANQTQIGGLLRVLLLWFRAVSAYSSRNRLLFELGVACPPTRSRVVMLAAVAFVGAAAEAHAGPCATQISQVEQQIRTLAAASPPGGAGDPSAPQSVGAQLHHQPTPGSVQSAEQAANADGEAALARARKADDEGNVSACAKALTEAKALYGIE